MRIAILHDHLCGIGGAERVFQYFCEEFAEADAYVLSHNRRRTLPYFARRGVRTTVLNPFVRTMEAYRWAFVPATYVWESLDLSAYDVVLTSSAHGAKYARVPNGVHICYCYFPTRAIWNRAEYFGTSLKGRALDIALPYLRRRDLAAASRIDRFIAISRISQQAIAKYYARDSEIMFPPVDLDRFHPRGTRGDHYLLVSRLETWKRVDYAIEAFNRLRLPLRVVGTGQLEQRLRAMAGPNITFLGALDDDALAREYAQARALIFTPRLEYGLTPLEAAASGTPVIGFGKDGFAEVMVPLGGADGRTPTAVFFDEQTADSLMAAVERFENAGAEFDSASLRAHAVAWGVPAFKRRIRELVESVG